MRKLLKIFFLIYSLQIIILPGAFSETRIECGVSVVDSISGLEEDKYFFESSANDALTIRISKVSGNADFLPEVELYSPEGKRIGSDYERIDKVLSENGVYSLVVKNCFDKGEGTYYLVYEKINQPCNTDNLNCAKYITGNISDDKRFSFYKFVLDKSFKVTIRIAGNPGFGPEVELYSVETGKRIGDDSERIDKVLDAGMYLLVISECSYYASGTYYIGWQKLNPPINDLGISYGDIKRGIIDTQVTMNAYSFKVKAKEQAIIDYTIDYPQSSNNFGCFLEIYDQEGNSLIDSYGRLKHTFEKEELVYLIVSDFGQNGVGEYDLSLSIDLIAPEVSLNNPKDKERVINGDVYMIRWTSQDNEGIVEQKILLSTDSGKTYDNVIVDGLKGSRQSYDWQIPLDLFGPAMRIKVVVIDGNGNQGEDSNQEDFSIIDFSLPDSALEVNYEYDQVSRIKSSRLVGNYSYDCLGNRISLEINEDK